MRGYPPKNYKRLEVIKIKQILHNFKDYYYLTTDGKVYSSKTKRYIKPYNNYNYRLMTTDSKVKAITLKDLYRLVYNENFCIDNIQDLPGGEIWRYIPGTNKMYQASDKGRIKSFYKYNSIIVKPSITAKGYERLQIIQNGQVVNYFLHRVIALCFLEEQPGANYQLHHIDGNPRNNKANNLKWVSQAEHLKIHNNPNQEKEKISNE